MTSWAPRDPVSPVDTRTARHLEDNLPEQLRRPIVYRLCNEVDYLREALELSNNRKDSQ